MAYIGYEVHKIFFPHFFILTHAPTPYLNLFKSSHMIFRDYILYEIIWMHFSSTRAKVYEWKEKKDYIKCMNEKINIYERKLKMDAAPGLPGRSPIPVLFRPKGA